MSGIWKRQVLAGICVLFFLSGCVTPKPVLTKRYEKASFLPDNEWPPKPSVKLSLFTLPVPNAAAPSKTVFDLSDHGQAEYIKLMGSNIKCDPGKKCDAGKLRQGIAAPIKTPSTHVPDESRIKIKRRLVFSIEKENFRPGDRVYAASISVTVHKSDAVFRSWSQFANVYKSVDLGKENISQTRKISLTGGISNPAVAPAANISATAEKGSTLTEEFALGRDLVTLSGTLNQNTATINLQGAPQIDLAGTVIADVSIQLLNPNIRYLVSFGNLFNNGKPNLPDSVNMTFQKVYYPTAFSELYGDLTCKYIVRRILSGADTVNEADDVVQYIKKVTHVPHVELVPHAAIRLFVWYIRDNQNNKLKLISPETGNEEVVYFATYDNAVEFLKWLKAPHKKPITHVAGIDIELPNSGVEALRVGYDELPPPHHSKKEGRKGTGK